jgi:hypothetical protein
MIQPEAVTAWLEKALAIGAPIALLLAVVFLLGLQRDADGRWMVRGLWGWGPRPVSTLLWQLAAIAAVFGLVHAFGHFWYGR